MSDLVRHLFVFNNILRRSDSRLSDVLDYIGSQPNNAANRRLWALMSACSSLDDVRAAVRRLEALERGEDRSMPRPEASETLRLLPAPESDRVLPRVPVYEVQNVMGVTRFTWRLDASMPYDSGLKRNELRDLYVVGCEYGNIRAIACDSRETMALIARRLTSKPNVPVEVVL